MLIEKVILNNEIGLHARPAAIFVQTANKYKSDIYLELDGQQVEAKSIIGVMSLGAFGGEEVTLKIDGKDQVEAMKDLKKLLEEGLLKI